MMERMSYSLPDFNATLNKGCRDEDFVKISVERCV